MPDPDLTNESIVDMILDNQDLSGINMFEYDRVLSAHEIFTLWAKKVPNAPLTGNQGKILRRVQLNLPHLPGKGSAQTSIETTKILLERQSWTAAASLHQRLRSPISTIKAIDALFPYDTPLPSHPAARIFCRVVARNTLKEIANSMDGISNKPNFSANSIQTSVISERYRRRNLALSFDQLRRTVEAIDQDLFSDAHLFNSLNKTYGKVVDVMGYVKTDKLLSNTIHMDTHWIMGILRRAALTQVAERSTSKIKLPDNAGSPPPGPLLKF